MNTAKFDVQMAYDYHEERNWPDSLLFVNLAIAQLESARAKLESEIANPTI